MEVLEKITVEEMDGGRCRDLDAWGESYGVMIA